jgi:hypothetical protein
MKLGYVILIWCLVGCLIATGCVACISWYDTEYTWVVVNKYIEVDAATGNSIYCVTYMRGNDSGYRCTKITPKEYYDNFRIGDTIRATNGDMD